MSGPKILFLDIETQPDLAWVWGAYEQNAIAIKEHWQVLSVAWRWRGQKTKVKALCDYPSYKVDKDDKALMLEVWGLLDQADIVIAHNGDDFDIKKLGARFIAHNLLPPAPYKTIDTKKAVKRVAAFSSNKLDWLCGQLEIGRKRTHEGFPLWEACMQGDSKAWRRMKDYNKHDITLLEGLYKRIAPWIRQPNALLYGGSCTNPACPGPGRLQARGSARSKTRSYTRWQCQDCGSWSQSVNANPERVERKPL